MTVMVMQTDLSAEVVAGGRVRAATANAHLQWVRDYHGDRAVSEVLTLLRGPAMAGLRAVEDGWIAFDTLLALDRAIERVCSRGRSGFFRELGRYTAHVGLLREGFRGEAMHDCLHRAALLHAQLHDFGVVAYEERGLAAGRMEHTSRCFSAVHCAATAGFYEQVLAAHHAVPLRVAEVACQCSGDASCVFELQWS